MDNQEYKKWVTTLFDGASYLYGKEGCSYFLYFAKKLVDLADPSEGSSILDIATGRGAILFRAAEKTGPSGKVIGIDISPQMISDTAKELQNSPLKNAELRVMDAEHLDFPDHYFDMIFGGFCLFFMPNVESVLKQCHKTLKKGGKIALSIWGERDPSYGLLHELLASYGSTTKIVCHTFEEPKVVTQLLQNAGFENIQMSEDVLDYVYPTLEAWWESLWGHGTRALLEKLSKAQQKELFEKLRERLAPRLQKDGFHQTLKAYYFIANA